ncbi:MAG: hypothetical protein GX906_06580 [Clostridiales bacterium]|jgi:hypothetical protein|nr:hypothetical protein [Clostridiales bacterium]
MKKFIAIISLVLIIAIFAVSLTGCGKDPFLTSAVWSDYEVLTYEIIEKEQKIGEMQVTIEKLGAGQYKLKDSETNAFAVASGTMVTKVAKDLDGKEILYSASLAENFVPVASYKKIDSKDKKIETRTRYSKSYYYYANNGGAEKRTKIKKNVLDNENLFEFIRCQELERSFNQVLTTVDAQTGATEKISIAVSGEGQLVKSFTYNDIDENEKTVMKGAKVYNVVVGKSTEPKGKSIVLQYIYKDAFNPLVKGGINKTSYFPLVRIEENNLTYNLTSIKFGK